MFQGAKLEIESVLREVCDQILVPSPAPGTSGSSPSSTELALSNQYVSKEKVRLRAVALQILGEAYMAVKKESANEDLGEGYVKVDVGGKPEQRR
jgi:hypothetical protein